MIASSYSTDGPKCPHCENVITPDEAHYFDENRYTQDECGQCGKKFNVEVHTHVSWRCTPISEAA